MALELVRRRNEKVKGDSLTVWYEVSVENVSGQIKICEMFWGHL